MATYSASFPDFSGAVTAADTLDDLRAEVEQVLAFHIEGMIEDGDDIPVPSAFDAVVQLEVYKDAVEVFVVKAPVAASPAVRINVTIPDQMLKRIDRHAAKHGLTQSGFLVLAAKKEIKTLVLVQHRSFCNVAEK